MLSFKTLVDFINRNDYINLKNFLENRHCNVDDTDEDKNLTALMVAASQGTFRLQWGAQYAPGMSQGLKI